MHSPSVNAAPTLGQRLKHKLTILHIPFVMAIVVLVLGVVTPQEGIARLANESPLLLAFNPLTFCQIFCVPLATTSTVVQFRDMGHGQKVGKKNELGRMNYLGSKMQHDMKDS